MDRIAANFAHAVRKRGISAANVQRFLLEALRVVGPLGLQMFVLSDSCRGSAARCFTAADLYRPGLTSVVTRIMLS